jgi:uncharacterized protein
METLVKEQELLSLVYAEVQQRFAGFADLAHGWEHVHRVYTTALYIAAQEGANQFIVGMAALMHDLGRLSHDAAQHHADRSALLAAELMTTYGLAPEIQRPILHAILAHSYSRGIEPQALEARVVRDADRLDGLGAIGILRWAITGTHRSTSATQAYHPEDPFAERHTPDDSAFMLDHFFTKLLKLHDSMATATGRTLAERRTVFMQTYLDELRDELQTAPAPRPTQGTHEGRGPWVGRGATFPSQP